MNNSGVGFPGGSVIKILPAISGFDPWIRKSPWRRKWEPTPVFLPGEYHGQEKPGGLQSMGSQSRTRLSHSCPGITLVLKSLCQAKLTVRMI